MVKSFFGLSLLAGVIALAGCGSSGDSTSGGSSGPTPVPTQSIDPFRALDEVNEDLRDLLASPVTIRTEAPVPVSEFMRLLSLQIPTRLNYVVESTAADRKVTAAFTGASLREVLDATLPAAGVTWEINPNNVVTIRVEPR